MSTKHLELLEYFFRALDAEIGVIVEVSVGSREVLRQHLYAARREHGTPEMSAIAVVVSPYNLTDLWLLKGNPDASQVEGGPSESDAPFEGGGL